MNSSSNTKKSFEYTSELRKQIAEAIASIDLEEVRFVKTLTIPERVQIGAMMNVVAEQNGANRLRQVNPELTEWDALRMYRSGHHRFLWERNRPQNVT